MKILIVDDEADILEIIEFIVQDFFPTGTVILTAQSGNEAIKLLENDPSIDICICDHNMPNGMGADVLKYIADKNLKTKFVLCSTVLPSEKPQEYPAEHVFSNIQKPDIGKGVGELLKLVEGGEKAPAIAEEFVPISVHILAMMERAIADIYIRMSDNKFVKCINMSEEFTSEDKDKYLAKSISELYVKKGDKKTSINEVILGTTQKIMERKNIPLSDKMSIVHSQLVSLIHFTGITPELAEASKKNVQQAVALIMKYPPINDFWKGINLLGEYPSKLYTLHSLLASVVIKKLQWNSEATMFKLTLASFLQDVSLDSVALMELCDYQEFLSKEAMLSSADIRKYLEHPHNVTKIISAFKEIPPDIDRILLEQHEMPDGNGFPRKLNANQLGPLSCVFIITGIFARHVLRDGKNFDLSAFVTQMEEKGYSRGNFKEAFEAIKAMKK